MKKLFKHQVARIKRIREMDAQKVREKLSQKAGHYWSYRSNVRRVAHALEGHSLRLFKDEYQERPEGGPTNLDTKINRAAHGGPFEPYSVSLINRAAVKLMGDANNVLEVGCGTGMFASLAARQNQKIQVTASEFDEKTLNWARENRAASNIRFVRLSFEECSTDQFDVVVALEVVEHIFDYPGFLEGFSRVAPRAIISTPNKSRTPFTSIANTPAYEEHVREWTAGEFYWVLRCFYDEVQLYTLPEFQSQIRHYISDPDYSPTVGKCSLLEREEPMIAKCNRPRRR